MVSMVVYNNTTKERKKKFMFQKKIASTLINSHAFLISSQKETLQSLFSDQELQSWKTSRILRTQMSVLLLNSCVRMLTQLGHRITTQIQ